MAKDHYYDHSLNAHDPCVTARVSSTGLFFIYLDYNPAYGSPGDCDKNLGIVGTSEDRTYFLTFPAASGICTALGHTASGGECTLVTDNSPRISADNLFAKNATSAPVEFMFGWNGYSYSHQTDHNATVSGSGTTRTASYAGTVSLWQVNPAPKKPPRVGSSFYCPFQLTLSEHAGTPGFYEHDCLLPLLWYIPSFTLLPIAHAECPRVEKRSWQQIGSLGG
jgi:hypothetical protein